MGDISNCYGRLLDSDNHWVREKKTYAGPLKIIYGSLALLDACDEFDFKDHTDVLFTYFKTLRISLINHAYVLYSVADHCPESIYAHNAIRFACCKESEPSDLRYERTIEEFSDLCSLMYNFLENLMEIPPADMTPEPIYPNATHSYASRAEVFEHIAQFLTDDVDEWSAVDDYIYEARSLYIDAFTRTFSDVLKYCSCHLLHKGTEQDIIDCPLWKYNMWHHFQEYIRDNFDLMFKSPSISCDDYLAAKRKIFLEILDDDLFVDDPSLFNPIHSRTRQVLDGHDGLYAEMKTYFPKFRFPVRKSEYVDPRINDVDVILSTDKIDFSDRYDLSEFFNDMKETDQWIEDNRSKGLKEPRFYFHHGLF
jgi:hypothetical protein